MPVFTPGRRWCRTDPVILCERTSTSGLKCFSATLYADAGLVGLATGPIAWEVKYPGGSGEHTECETHATDDGFGEGETVTYASQDNLDYTSGKMQVRARITDYGLGSLTNTFTNSLNNSEVIGTSDAQVILESLPETSCGVASIASNGEISDAGNAKVFTGTLNSLLNQWMKYGVE